jgi:hypothetical protein
MRVDVESLRAFDSLLRHNDSERCKRDRHDDAPSIALTCGRGGAICVDCTGRNQTCDGNGGLRDRGSPSGDKSLAIGASQRDKPNDFA